MKIHHRSILLGVSVLLVFLFVPSFSFSDNIKIALRRDPGLSEPYADLQYFGSFQSINIVVRNIHDSLFYVLPDASIRMGTAEKFEANSDGSVWRIFLRRGIKFHNGKIVNANDVKFSFNRVLKSGIGWLRDRFSSIQDIKVVDDFTFEVLTKGGFAFVPYILGHYLPIVPSDYDSENPIGCGPYRLVKYSKGSDLSLEGFKDYYGGSPDFERVDISFIPDRTARELSFMIGQVDAASDISYEKIGDIIKKKRAYLIPQKNLIYYIGINTNRPNLKEKPVRQGLNYAIDRVSIIKKVFNGKALLNAVPISADSFAANPDITPYSHNTERARNSIKSGFETKLAYFEPDPLLNEQAFAITEQLKRIGVNAELQPYKDYSLFLRDYENEKLDLYIGRVWDRSEPYFYLNYLFNSPGRLKYYNNPEVIQKLEKIKTSVGRGLSIEIYRELDKTLHDDAPLIYLYKAPESFSVGSEKYSPLIWIKLMTPSNRCIRCSKETEKSDCGDGYKCVNGCCKKS